MRKSASIVYEPQCRIYALTTIGKKRERGDDLPGGMSLTYCPACGKKLPPPLEDFL